MLGLGLMLVYALSVGAYLAFLVFGYRAATGGVLVVIWTFVAAIWPWSASSSGSRR